MYDKLQKWIEKERQVVNQLAEDSFLKMAKKYGDINKDNFKALPKVQHLIDLLSFFKKEKLLD